MNRSTPVISRYPITRFAWISYALVGWVMVSERIAEEERWVCDLDQNMVLYMAKEAVGAVLLVGGPILGVSLLVGLMVSIFQAMTQIQEQTLTFIPKVVAVVAVLMILGPWMLSVLTVYTANLLKQLASFGGM